MYGVQRLTGIWRESCKISEGWGSYIIRPQRRSRSLQGWVLNTYLTSWMRSCEAPGWWRKIPQNKIGIHKIHPGSHWSDFAPQGTFSNVTTFCHNRGGAPGIYWGEARDAVKHSTMHRTAPTLKDDLAPNVNGAEVEKYRSSTKQSYGWVSETLDLTTLSNL